MNPKPPRWTWGIEVLPRCQTLLNLDTFLLRWEKGYYVRIEDRQNIKFDWQTIVSIPKLSRQKMLYSKLDEQGFSCIPNIDRQKFSYISNLIDKYGPSCTQKFDGRQFLLHSWIRWTAILVAFYLPRYLGTFDGNKKKAGVFARAGTVRMFRTKVSSLRMTSRARP